MKGKLVALSLCSLFFLALITVKLKTREMLIRYEIAELSLYENLMRERYSFLESEVAEKAGGVPLLTKSLQLGIQLKLNGNGGQGIPLLAPVSDKAAME